MGKTRGRGLVRPGDKAAGASDEDKLYLQPPLLELRVPEPQLLFLTDLPGGVDEKEWLASHTIGFFEHINLLYGTVSEFCTTSACPEMTGPGNRQYLWLDEKGKKSKLAAPQYVDYIMTYVQKAINDETLFPTKHGADFPTSFVEMHIRKIHRLLFHVLAHVYHAHFKEIVLLQLHAHLNALFAHFVEFNKKFQTIEEKELEVLEDLILALRLIPIQDGQESSDQIDGSKHPSSQSSSAPLADASEENKENVEDMVICSQPMQTSELPAAAVSTGNSSEEPCSLANNSLSTSEKQHAVKIPSAMEDANTSVASPMSVE